ncbi:hypothetical protein BDF20DRAFT_818033 [Mycotypha africana]|uniref:uncharacterized protein n=1 Tax=Mycotypha africana TaxID=64632 RepID=UPI0023000B84|nr:uncharacterized protein BDF20DRAFT_818033 [Mycotypha africana]KAI8982051.1 hypothetical protein BDF20DRAFT_818033 [Mycotypha africana]
MKFLFLYTASVLLSAVAVWASSVTLTEPEPNQVWETGSTVHIKWKVNDPKAAKKIRLQYASGPSQALVINGLIADRVNGSSGSYSWKIPKDLKPKKYVIEAGPSAKDLSFAGRLSTIPLEAVWALKLEFFSPPNVVL